MFIFRFKKQQEFLAYHDLPEEYLAAQRQYELLLFVAAIVTATIASLVRHYLL